eukprot:CAMPEP_0170547320 /NCGR_PEP_ID=MMETSP0211-20121228/5703_1 /TAXON_ID=311385 /ORGANISM="Pseudokeronopsis sp., Strain OXSARD2" /LENGTH=120 /DNA_ID=CAMNT_0010852291 /DNA_START=688 /DNA_END=1050 /DNA_ORIENTATION=-
MDVQVFFGALIQSLFIQFPQTEIVIELFELVVDVTLRAVVLVPVTLDLDILADHDRFPLGLHLPLIPGEEVILDPPLADNLLLFGLDLLVAFFVRLRLPSELGRGAAVLDLLLKFVLQLI